MTSGSESLDASPFTSKEVHTGFCAWPEGVPIKLYTGGCHCRNITYTFEHPVLEQVEILNCNCSICTMKGHLAAMATPSRFKLTKGSLDDMQSYTFNKRLFNHYFCKTCGISPFLMAPAMNVTTVNVRTVDGIDLDALNLKKIDGAKLL